MRELLGALAVLLALAVVFGLLGGEREDDGGDAMRAAARAAARGPTMSTWSGGATSWAPRRRGGRRTGRGWRGRHDPDAATDTLKGERRSARVAHNPGVSSADKLYPSGRLGVLWAAAHAGDDPEHSEVHISCTFTWDRELARDLAYQWEVATDKPVKLGGPAFHSPVVGFTPGLYLRPNIIFTTRGCNNNCQWCIVPGLEGKLQELPIYPGNIIQDNNFLQASRTHKDRVFEMLKTQRGICFKGGLQASLLDNHFVEAVRGLRISELWLACDTDAAISEFKRAAQMLVNAGFGRDKIRCYCLIGDDMDRNESRLREVYHAGATPFAQLYRDFSDTKTEYDTEWNRFARMWQRPAAISAHMERGTDFRDFAD